MSHLFKVPVIRCLTGEIVEVEEYFPNSSNFQTDIEGQTDHDNCVHEGTISYDYKKEAWSFEPAATEKCTVDAIILSKQGSETFATPTSVVNLLEEARISAQEGILVEGAILHSCGKFEYSENVAYDIFKIEVDI